MKADAYHGGFEYLAKAFAHQLHELAHAVTENHGATPASHAPMAAALAQSLAKTWAKGDGKTFRDIAALLDRSHATGVHPGRWEHEATFYARKVAFRNPTKRRRKTATGWEVLMFPIDLDATAAQVVAEAKADGVSLQEKVAEIALKKIRDAAGFPARRGRPRNAKTSAEAKRVARLRQGTEGKKKRIRKSD